MAYQGFALIYDDLMKDDFDYEEWFKYIEEIYAKLGLRVENVLEMACGTGNIARCFAEAGYSYTGFDLSIDMLTLADKKLNSYKNLDLIKQDMISFELGKKYDSVISLCDSINYILDYDDLISTFKNVYDHLEDEGVFIFDINSKYKFYEILADNNFIDERQGVFYTWENFLEDDICEFYLNFFVEGEDGSYRRIVEEHYERAYSMDEIEKALRQAGFTDINSFDAFSFEGVKEDSERINYVIRK